MSALACIAAWAVLWTAAYLYIRNEHRHGRRLERTTRRTDHTQAREWGL